MKESKDTRIEYCTQSGKRVAVNVRRVYGSYTERHHDSENGVDYDTERFADESEITVDVEGVCKFRTKYLPEAKHPKINMHYLSDGRVTVAVPDDAAEKIWSAERERLNDELSPSARESVEKVKKAVMDGRVAPEQELVKKRRAYNKTQNEGGEGYNPYDDYLTEEYVAYVKSEYPDQFN